MNKIRHLILATVVLIGISAAHAETKLATVDMKKLFNGYYKTKLAQASLENRRIELRKDIKDMADELDKAQADYKNLLDQAGQPALAAEEREKRQKAVAEKAKDMSSKFPTIVVKND